MIFNALGKIWKFRGIIWEKINMFDYIKHKDFQMARNRILKIKKNTWELIFASKMTDKMVVYITNTD